MITQDDLELLIEKLHEKISALKEESKEPTAQRSNSLAYIEGKIDAYNTCINQLNKIIDGVTI